MAAVVAIGTTAAIAAEPIEMGNENREIIPGVEYIIPSYQASSGYYTAPQTGRIQIEGAQDFVPYADIEHTEIINTNNLDNIGKMKWFEVEKGETIYFYTRFAMNRNIFVLYQDGISDNPLKVSSIQPRLGERVDFNNYPAMTVDFNQEIRLAQSTATISFTDRLTGKTCDLSTHASASGQLLTVTLYSVLRPYMESGAITLGDEFRVIVGGLTTTTGLPYADADAEGNAVFSFLCGALPVVAVRQYCPEPFLSYWAEGAPEGILTMEFDAPLMDDGKTFVELGWGNAEGEVGEYYAEIITCEIDGNKLSADFTGKLRTPATMTPAFPNASYSSMMVKLNNVRDTSGMPVASPGQGTIGSYTFAPEYQLLERSTVIADFSPSNGSLLSSVSRVNVWLSGLSAIRFDGFTLTVTDKEDKVSSIIIPLKDVDVIDQMDNEAEYEFDLPADVHANAKRVEITLANVLSIDGYDHSNDVRCMYGGFTITSATPRNGSEISVLAAGSEIFMRNNLSSTYPQLYVEYMIEEADPAYSNPVIKEASRMTRNDDGSYTAIVDRDVKLMAGHNYKVIFTAWEDESSHASNPDNILGSDYVIWKGLTPAYHYSGLSLISVEPAEDEVLTADTDKITLLFDGYVSLGKASGSNLRTYISLGNGETLPFKKVVPMDPMDYNGTEVANEWQLVLPDDYVAGLSAPLSVSFTAYDQDGAQLRGNAGEEDQACYEFSWYVEAQFATPHVQPVGEAPLQSVREFTARHDDGINVSSDVPVGEAVVMDGNGEVIARVEHPVIPDGDTSGTLNEIRLMLDREVTGNGTYTLFIPQGYFSIGQAATPLISTALEVEFIIGSGVGVDTMESASDPADVYSATGILLIRQADAADLRSLTPGLYIIGDKKVKIR